MSKGTCFRKRRIRIPMVFLSLSSCRRSNCSKIGNPIAVAQCVLSREQWGEWRSNGAHPDNYLQIRLVTAQRRVCSYSQGQTPSKRCRSLICRRDKRRRLPYQLLRTGSLARGQASGAPCPPGIRLRRSKLQRGRKETAGSIDEMQCKKSKNIETFW